ncbi:GntR family transcriptional regulator [Curtobacterium sp. PhB115]|uniref:GntR family transcriptional regulator n=1 Tax=Curtobacterium sp. PhB115 TaxID=2485173 RepID=UPI000F4BAA2A|nr:GntR family transcriptional regulator [Curtobacterium sp. PhB115]ROP74039.1 DNA-binding GntR family transcriptional regulator [Curtobacterium sp. PhB115]
MSTEAFSDLPLAQASSLVQQVHAELKARVLDGRLEAGAVVPDSVIAKQMGVSRNPVRDACNVLVQSGLLTKQRNRPYRVREFTTSDLGELQLLRWGYESAAVRHIVRHRLPVPDVAQHLDAMTTAHRADDARASGLADLAFHHALVGSAGLPELQRRHRSVMEQLSVSMSDFPRFVLPTQRHRHQEIIEVLEDSIAQGDPAGILRLLEVHLLTTRADVAR